MSNLQDWEGAEESDEEEVGVEDEEGVGVEDEPLFFKVLEVSAFLFKLLLELMHSLS